jgi:iron-sulfur cluster repair protein YtfE (RIC family)
VASTDPLEAFEHDHQALNEQVLRLGPLLAELQRGDLAGAAAALADHLVSLRDDLFLHFAREEEGLFPYLAEIAPDLEPSVAELVSMHDEICGAVARMIHVAGNAPRFDTMQSLFDRFEVAYAGHAQAEHRLLETAASRLTGAQRGELAAMVAGI